MGLIARLLSFSRVDRGGVQVAEVQADPGAGANVTADVYAGAGVDAQPLPEDYTVLLYSPATGRVTAVGFADVKNTGTAGAGEHRLYARDSAGNPVNQVWLKSDGSILVDNGSGSIELEPSGNVKMNGVTIDTQGNISTLGDISGKDLSALNSVSAAVQVSAPAVEASASLKVAGIEMSTHIHPTAPPGPISPPAPGGA